MSKDRQKTRVIRITKAVYELAMNEERPSYIITDTIWFSYLIHKGLEKIREERGK